MDSPVDTSSSTGVKKKVFARSNRTHTTPSDLESMASSGKSNGRSSIESTPEKTRSKSNADAVLDDTANNAKTGSSGIARLLPGRRKKKKHASTQQATGPGSRAFQSQEDVSIPGPSANGNLSAREPPGESNGLLTDDSEPDQTPSLTTHNSHAGYLTASSPLITTTNFDGIEADTQHAGRESSTRYHISTSETFPGHLEKPSASSSPGSVSSKRSGVSPRRLVNALTPSLDKKSRSVSPDRASSRVSEGRGRSGPGDLEGGNGVSLKKPVKYRDGSPPPLPKPIRVTSLIESSNEEPSEDALKTSPDAGFPPIMTTITPPSPIESHSAQGQLAALKVASSPALTKKIPENLPPGAIVSPSGNMISHRRVRSASTTHMPSKLSHSMTTQLDPTPEESKQSGPKNLFAGQQSGFFSSMFSAAQNAASTISSSLNTQSRVRNVTQPAEIEEPLPVEGSTDDMQQLTSENDQKEKELAVNTLGSGDLNFSHLEIDAPSGGVVTTKDGMVITNPDIPIDDRKPMTISQRDELSAKIEDFQAARAVSMAYEKPDTSSNPPIVDDATEAQPVPSKTKESSGVQTPPNGNTVEGEESGSIIRRSGSVRSRLTHRRHRGSSGATGSTIGAIGASALSLGLPATNVSLPRLTGFAVASKKRNRDFHQLFRSVPEDDYLIEDYSCALQREIILAGRIYISEGHICFSSNILGWVTTLVISFDEVVATEKETTAMVFPNAIAIQTLHARHTFRSLLSRESTYDLMVNIWKINHPSLKSSVNGTRIDQGTGDKTEKVDDSDMGSDASEEEVYDEDEDGQGVGSFADAAEASITEKDQTEFVKPLSSKTSTLASNAMGAAFSTPALVSALENKVGEKASGEPAADFPGPITHSPTEFNDPSGRYDKVVKDDIVPAPLGRVYSLIFGPASGSFMSRFLLEESKCTELRLEDDKKGLTNDNKTRQYSYIRPLNASIGPRQTKCISTETLDIVDLEKAVLVTLSTQTPDVPSGNVFLTKTKYLLTWAPGNQTRFFMSCTIEWLGKSWLKGPIEKGAIDGQTAFGNDLVKALKAAVTPRGRVNGALKNTKAGKARRKLGEVGPDPAAVAVAAAAAGREVGKRESDAWGMFEPFRRPLFNLFGNANFVLGVMGILLLALFFRNSLQTPVSGVGYPMPQRLAAYEEMWQREETELWNWLEERVGLDRLSVPIAEQTYKSQPHQRQKRQKSRGRELNTRLNEEKMADREIDHAIQVTRERLKALEEVIAKRRGQHSTVETPSPV
ncbi:hypothetical protein V8E54_006846 [Elaphomyces granulatus]